MRLFCLPPFSLPVSCCDVTSDFWAFSRESAGEIFLGVLYLILDNCDSVDILQRLTPPLLFFTGSYDNTVRIWDVASQQQVAQLTGHTNYVTSVAFDGSGKYLASGEMTQAWSVLRHIFPPFLECWACVLLRAECWFWCWWWWGLCDGGGDDVIVFDAVVSHEMWLVVGFVWWWWWSVGDVTMWSLRHWFQ